MPAGTWRDGKQGRTAGSGNKDRGANHRYGGNSGDQADDALNSAERLRRLKRLSMIARLMDTAVGIPGTRLRFGADSSSASSRSSVMRAARLSVFIWSTRRAAWACRRKSSFACSAISRPTQSSVRCPSQAIFSMSSSSLTAATWTSSSIISGLISKTFDGPLTSRPATDPCGHYAFRQLRWSASTVPHSTVLPLGGSDSIFPFG